MCECVCGKLKIILTLFLKQKRGKWLAPGNISWAMLGMAVNVFSTTSAITLCVRACVRVCVHVCVCVRVCVCRIG